VAQRLQRIVDRMLISRGRASWRSARLHPRAGCSAKPTYKAAPEKSAASTSATGKILKTRLREDFKDYKLPTA
jgi:hypothetical protein